VSDDAAISDARRWFLDHGWEVRVVERNRQDEMRARKETYLPAFSHRFWVDLARVGSEDHVVENYASGTNEIEAVIRARQRYGSEQT
jgi:esterase/lipase superfamily enzyme